MSFRWFIYWCALCGGWAAFAGWALGRLLAGEVSVASTGIKGMFLGMLIALGLGLVDALWVFSLRQMRLILPRVLACVAIGSTGGLIGGMVGQALFDWKNQALLLILAWVITGLMVGVSIGMFDLLRCYVRQESLGAASRKVLRGVLGGIVGGLLGGFLYWELNNLWIGVFPRKINLLSPSATGFVALGLCIGLMIGIAQVLLKEGWLKIERGRRQGRELMLTKPLLTIGRAEACDIGLFGDPLIDRLHARILQQGNHYILADAGSATGTFVNEERLYEPRTLHSGDAIRVGNTILRFGERQKRH